MDVKKVQLKNSIKKFNQKHLKSKTFKIKTAKLKQLN